MRRLLEDFRRAVELNRESGKKGFTLIELLIVIAIIAILASMAIPSYIKYQAKAKVSSYAEPVARGCLMDIITYCMEHPEASSADTNNLPNCKSPQKAPDGKDIKIADTKTNCDKGQPKDGDYVIAKYAPVSDYEAKCEYKNGGVRCLVEPASSSTSSSSSGG